MTRELERSLSASAWWFSVINPNGTGGKCDDRMAALGTASRAAYVDGRSVSEYSQFLFPNDYCWSKRHCSFDETWEAGLGTSSWRRGQARPWATYGSRYAHGVLAIGLPKAKPRRSISRRPHLQERSCFVLATDRIASTEAQHSMLEIKSLCLLTARFNA